MEQEDNNEKLIIAFDATELDNFETCIFKWHIFHHRHIVPKTTKNYLEAGSLLHYLLELYYKRKRDKGILTIEQTEIEEIVELSRIESLKFDLELTEIADIIFQFREYHRYYENENIIPVHIEEPFMVQIYEDEDFILYLSGKPDLTFKYPNSSDLNVLDHKKIGREHPISQLRNQFMLYALAIGTDTVVVNKIGFQKTKKASERFQRPAFVYQDEVLAEFKEDLIGRAKEMILHEKLSYYPRTRASCEKWDGCWYQRYCSTRPSAREFLIGREYIIGDEWNPSLKLETETKEGE